MKEIWLIDMVSGRLVSRANLCLQTASATGFTISIRCTQADMQTTRSIELTTTGN